jgi:hypothetical protein
VIGIDAFVLTSTIKEEMGLSPTGFEWNAFKKHEQTSCAEYCDDDRTCLFRRGSIEEIWVIRKTCDHSFADSRN